MTAEQFRNAQFALNLSTAKMAEKLGISPRTVQQYRQGSRPIPKIVENFTRKLVEAKIFLD